MNVDAAETDTEAVDGVNEPDELVLVAQRIRDEITALIRWASANSPRSLQAAPGPSELGNPCDRRLAYRLAGITPLNHHADPLAAVVGTGLHSWLEQMVIRFNATFGDNTLVPETRLQIDPIVRGTSDLYHRELKAVIDYKGASADVIRKAQQDGPSQGYKVQTHLYGLGYEQAGLDVEIVAIIYIPRAGTLKGIHVWVDRYDRQVAQDALDRMYRIGDQLLQFGDDPTRFDRIAATPDAKSCWFCPYVGAPLDPVATADGGCPGH